MAVNVRIPTPLRKLTEEKDIVSGDGGTLIACIEELAIENARLRRDLDRLGQRLTPAP